MPTMHSRYPGEIAPDFPREWVEFFDPDDSQHLIAADMTWLLSSWTCAFGTPACLGVIRKQPQAGCCSHGAFLSDADDYQRLSHAVSLLDDDDWQLRSHGLSSQGYLDCDINDEGVEQFHTRILNGACIFLNQPDFPAGGGCALHIKAIKLGYQPLKLKPDVCWQLPIYRSQEWVRLPDNREILKTTLTEFDRSCWGPGGADMDWYCTGDPGVHTGTVSLWQSLSAELIELIGQRAYEQLAKLCQQRADTGLVAPHPASLLAHSDDPSHC